MSLPVKAVVQQPGQPAVVQQQQYVTQTTTVSTPRNNCCFYYLVIVQFVVVLLFGVTMGGLHPVPVSKNVEKMSDLQQVYTKVTNFAYSHVIFATSGFTSSSLDDDKMTDDLGVTSMALYSSFNFVQAAIAIGAATADPTSASSDMAYYVADWSGDKCEFIGLAAYNAGDVLQFCDKYGGSCQSSGKGAGALFVFCFLISLALCVSQFMRVSKDSSTMMVVSIVGQAIVLLLSIVASILFSLSCPVKVARGLFDDNNVVFGSVSYSINGGAIQVVAIVAIIATFVQICINGCCAPVQESITTQVTTQATPIQRPGVPIQQPGVLTDTVPSPMAQIEAEQRQLWVYIDPQNEVRGPFDSATMKAWHESNYFSVETMICLPSWSSYHRLGDVFPESNEAFVSDNVREPASGPPPQPQAPVMTAAEARAANQAAVGANKA